jgi:two-component system, NtrC family, sensor kinase
MRPSGPLLAVDPALVASRTRRTGLGLRWLVLITLAILTVGTVLLIGLAVLRINQNNLEEQKVREGVAIAALVSQTVLLSVDTEQPIDSADNRARLKRLATMHQRVRGVEQIVVFDTHLRTLATNPARPDSPLKAGVEVASVVGSGVPYHQVIASSKGRELLVFGPVAQPGKAPHGAVGVRLPLGDVDAKIAASQNLLVLYMIVDALVVLLIGYFLMTRLIVRPIVEIGRGTQRVSQGNYSKLVRVAGAGEIGQLAGDFNAMLRQLRAQRDALENQVQRLESTNVELAQAQASLIRSEKLATVGRLGAGMAHEVGNPLAAVLGYVEILREGDLDEAEQADLLVRVERDLHRIDTILRDLLDYARADRDQALGPVDVRAVVDNSLDLVRAQPRSRNVTFSTQTLDVPLVRAHEGRLHQVLVNLVLNAADALGGEGDVTVSAAVRDDGWVEVQVEDNGPGIALDVLPHMFEPFFTTKDPGTGTGLGLAICQSIMVGLGGEIRATNTGSGARFTIGLPPAV